MINIPLFIFFLLLIVVTGWYALVQLRKWIKPGTTALRTLLYMISALFLMFAYIVLMFGLFFYFNGPFRTH